MNEPLLILCNKISCITEYQNGFIRLKSVCCSDHLQIEDKDGCGSANITRDQAGYGDMESFIWGSELMFEAHVIERGTSKSIPLIYKTFD